MNSYATIYRDRKNRLRLSSLDCPPSFYDSALPLLRFACSFALTLFVSVWPFRIARLLILPGFLCFPGRVKADASLAVFVILVSVLV